MARSSFGAMFGGRDTMLPTEPAPWEWEEREGARERVMEQELSPAARKKERAAARRAQRQVALERRMARERKAMIPPGHGVDGFGAMFGGGASCAISHEDIRRLKSKVNDLQRSLELLIRRR